MHGEFSLAWRSQKEWNWQVALDLFSGGLGAGLYLVSLWLNSVLGGWIGLGLVLFAGLVLLSHLGKPGRALRALARFSTSWISRGVVFNGLFVVLAGLHLLGATQGNPSGQLLPVLSAVVAVLIMLYPAFVLTSSPSIPFWNSPLLPVIFVTFSVTGGILVLLALGQVAAAEAATVVQRLALPLLGANLVLLAIYLEVMHHSTAAARESVRLLLQGRVAVTFLLGVVGLGTVVPLILLALAAAGGLAAPLLQAAAVTGLIGGYLLRQCLLGAGVYGPPI